MKITFLFPCLWGLANLAFGQTCDNAFYYYDDVISNSPVQIAIPDQPGYWVAAASKEPATAFSDMTLIRADALGNEMWRKHYGAPNQSDLNRSLLVTHDGHLILAGEGNNKVRLVKVDDTGAVVWEKEYGENGKQYEVSQIYEDAQGNLLLAGRLTEGGNTESMLVLKLDAQGVQLKKLVTNPYIAAWAYSWYPAGFG